jgi:hypothetical protein
MTGPVSDASATPPAAAMQNVKIKAVKRKLATRHSQNRA